MKEPTSLVIITCGGTAQCLQTRKVHQVRFLSTVGALFERLLFVYGDRNDGKPNQGTGCSLLFVNKVPFVLKKIF